MDLQNFGNPLLNYPDPPEFDYGAFLQADDDGISSGPRPSDVSSSRTTPPSSGNRSSSVASCELIQSAAQKQRLERRGHTKSRRGCYNCKRRRIKCQETRPACGHCVKTGLKCEYPSLPQITHQPHHQIPLFSLQDMRFFQHFLTQCYPHHPLKQEDIWTHEVPCIAHNHEFLMHAILGYSASELIASDPTLVTPAMNHRVRAIKALKKRLSDSANLATTHEEANAMVATCFALTFQSVSLDDGLAEYMTFIRGIIIVALQMMFKGIRPIFTTLFERDQDAILAPLMETLPLIQRGWADGAIEAITNLRPLCLEPVEVEYHEKLMVICEKLYINSYEAYKANTSQYGWWMLLPHNKFQELLNHNNQVMLLLHSHWIALAQIMTFINEQEFAIRKKHPEQLDPATSNNKDPGFVRWLKFLNARVDYEHQLYNQWPMWVDEQLDRDMTFFGRGLSL